jgi:Histidine kinase
MRKSCFLIIYLWQLGFIFASQPAFAVGKDSLSLALHITQVEIGGVDFPVKKSYNIDYSHNVVKAYFVANQPNVSFKYRLAEFEFEKKIEVNWQTTQKTEAKISDIKPGRYVFEVLASNGKLQSAVAAFDFKIETPWWRSWWFWGACFVSLFGLFYGRERFLKFWAEEEQRHNKQVTELELRTLQLQMNPHFVFNALNAVQSFIMTHDSISANNYLSKFAHLIRLFLDSSRSKYISLADEIKLLNLYVDMELLRFQNKFEFSMNIAPDVNRFVEVPTMLLQPFVENAINHGLRYRETKGLLTVEFRNQGKYLICRIEDNGVGRERAKQIQMKSRKGYKSQGLKIMEERLKTFNLIGDTDIQFLIEDKIKHPSDPNTDVGTVIEIKFPKNG